YDPIGVLPLKSRLSDQQRPWPLLLFLYFTDALKHRMFSSHEVFHYLISPFYGIHASNFLPLTHHVIFEV
uniref:hypothetical protein n=1 Tax=Hafnia paralvei TaxID=546367 RepID=UPI0006613059